MDRTRNLSGLAVPGAALATLVLVAGCGSGSSTNATVQNAGATTPPAEQLAVVQMSASAVDAVSQSSAAASDAIIQGGTSASASTRAASGSTAATPFHFANSGTFTVDLDAADGLGGDRYPNATGRFTVSYSGSVVSSQPTGSGGTAGYDVSLTFDTDVVSTDPGNGARATIDRGSSIAYGLEITWNRPDADHWTLSSDAQLTVPTWSGSLVKGSDTASGTHSGHAHETHSLAYDAGAFTYVPTIVSHWNSTVTRNGATHAVVWDRPSIDRISVTVDGITYGPYTRAQASAILHANVH